MLAESLPPTPSLTLLPTLLPTLLLVAWLAPLASFVVTAIAASVLARRTGGVDARSARAIGLVATGAITTSLAASLAALVAWTGRDPAGETSVLVGEWFTFLEVGTLRVAAGYYVDALTVLMTVVVTTVATCVHVYSLGYLAEEVADDGPEAVVDRDAPDAAGQPLRRPGRLHRYYQHLSLFSFAMLGLVLAGNVAMTFVFWELVGASSYLLIGFYYERDAAGRAATKAMLFNRVGDVGMLVGLLALWQFAGTLDYAVLFAADLGYLAENDAAAYTLITLAGVGLFCGCVGKSAQAPLFGWLPDAMAGPTPVSALVHSATMVAAGVFYVGRITPLLTPEVLVGIASVGAVTLLIGGLLATAASDLKRVLAYSTVSQLGFMLVGLGLGGWTAGLFHLTTHAAFKALLFLAAGSVLHAAHTGELAKLGGLAKRMPKTAALMLVGLLALVGAGVPELSVGLSGYYSKDAILEQAIAFSRTNPGYAWLWWACVVGATLTAFYATRLGLMTFLGEPRSDGARDAHEAGRAMVVPMLVLGVLAVVLGWSVPGFTASIPKLIESASPDVTHDERPAAAWSGLVLPAEHAAHTKEIKRVAAWSAFGALAIGASLAVVLHRGGRPLRTAPGDALRWIDRVGLSAASRSCESAAVAVGGVVARLVDRGAIDGGVAGGARGVLAVGRVVRRLETGSLRQYVSLLALGVVLVGSIALVAASRWMEAG